jgi:uncharacterized GH25 family protein
MKNNNMTLIGAAILIIVVAGAFFLLKGNGSSASAQQIELVTQPNPAQTGNNTFYITVRDDSGKAVDNAKVEFDLNMTTMNMGTQKGTATSQGSGKYAATGRLSMRGPWRVSTTVTYADGNAMKKDFVVNVP